MADKPKRGNMLGHLFGGDSGDSEPSESKAGTNTNPKPSVKTKPKSAKKQSKRANRQLKIDFESAEDLQRFKELANKLGVGYSRLALLFIEHGQADIKAKLLDIEQYLKPGRVEWLRKKDIDVEQYLKDRE